MIICRGDGENDGETVSVYLTPLWVSELDHMVKNVLVSKRHVSTFYFVGWFFLTHHLIFIFGCHAQERLYICDRRSLSPSALVYMYTITRAT